MSKCSLGSQHLGYKLCATSIVHGVELLGVLDMEHCPMHLAKLLNTEYGTVLT